MFKSLVVLIASTVCIFGCGGGGSDGGQYGRASGFSGANYGCAGTCTNFNLTTEDVTKVLQQGIAAAEQLGVAATFSIVDRVGNVLAVYAMPGATAITTINGQIGAVGGLEGVGVPSVIAAISKAGTGAYLSSQGNAFSTRTASQIIQEHFNPGEGNQPGGPLFGVQFSQLICGDVTTINPDLLGGISAGSKFKAPRLVGPRSLPLGLSADPGGIPLYKFGDVVGGIGVELDGAYTLDRNIIDTDNSLEERIALIAGRNGFEIPSERTGDRIFALGKSLRTVDLSYDDLDPLPEVLPVIVTTNLIKIPFYFDGNIKAGATFGTASSGILKIERAGLRGAILTDEAGTPRFPTRSGKSLLGGLELTSLEVDALLNSALLTASRTRAAIRQPLDFDAEVTIFIVDTEGSPLGMVRSNDAPVFGIDVALQKARTAAFFSSPDAAISLDAARARNGVGEFSDYAGLARAFFGREVFNGTIAFSNRAIGNIARPFFLDGIDGSAPGPFSLPFPGVLSGRTFSPFNTGLELDLVFQRTVQPLGIPQNPPSAVPDSCTDTSVFRGRLRNGIQIFPGSVPLYRNGTLIGAIGISGDGVDQDDLVAFYSPSRLGLDAIGQNALGDPVIGFNAPKDIRSDTVLGPLPNTRLRYVNCPEGPFRGSNEQRVCEGL